ncbi:xanthine dehydrogenase small subunit [Alteromonas gilva]|uniref:Xanthine dehydrogenase small subunit n=1 Tax=Alteromonas gilva TaxID=2987522 RepID=A0ABT5L6I6_9ALTE|nr:xanthine dehydrogenase small subunit [Alteromonas gilva]MDC8831457.1 xanthine dehydrogenase small subunit [Alteromonas gilva]
MIKFLLNNELVTLDNKVAEVTVQQYLRDNKALKGSKEGCASGDCGACTVVLGEIAPDQQRIHYRSINSCITLLASLHGKQLISVEHLSHNGALHPVQQSLVDHHGSQCGFCTPGIVMSMFALYHTDTAVNRDTINTALSGNLCRCTGYRPIIDATRESCGKPAGERQPDQFTRREAQTLATLQALQAESSEPATMNNVFLPQSRTEVAELLARYPDARFVAGSTDLALEYTQQLKSLPTLISTTRVKECRDVTVTDDHISVGAALPLNDITALLTQYFPALHELIDRFASIPVRNQATLGGNIANASPIGDMPPVLLALNGAVETDNGSEYRTVAAREFFTGYRQTVLNDKEWISAIRLPRLSAAAQLKAYKVSKRHEDDISAVCAVFNIELDGSTVKSLHTGFGGVAATPVCCHALEQHVVGKDWRNAQLRSEGMQILSEAFSPIDDVRASAAYRKQLLANLWQRFWFETQSELLVSTRVAHYA